MNAHSKSQALRAFFWLLAGVVLGALLAINPFYDPHLTLLTGIIACFLDLALGLMLSANFICARIGTLLAGMFLAVPCFVEASPFGRGLLMVCTALPLAIVAVPLMAPAKFGFHQRMEFFFSWAGTHPVRRQPSRFDAVALLQSVLATLIFAAMVAVVRTVSPSGLWPVRWLVGGIMIFAFAEIVTAGHKFVTTLLGVYSSALLRSPYLSTSLGEFWNERWNPGASLLFRKFWFELLPRRYAGFALFTTFLISAVVHTLLFYMATVKWNISLMCGAFFLVQPLFIVLERKMKVRRWRVAAARVWTLAVLAVTSPLFVEPMLQIVEPGWADSVLIPTIAVFVFVMTMNGFFALGSFATVGKSRVV
jgi:hypothetical protein